MVSSGLRDAGYQYVNIDDCWQEKRGNDGRIIPFASKFPSGMKTLADYVHNRGLKFGLYSDTGNHTCEGYPGSWGYEALDAQTYADWGVDYLKYDYCDMGGTTVSVKESYTTMRDALNRTGRPVLYSLCSWGTGGPSAWGAGVGNSWRTSIDMFAAWDEPHAQGLKLPSFLQSVLGSIHHEEELAGAAGPGGFNDLDMLVVGLDGMYPYGIVQDCPEHIKNCKPGQYISREQWGLVGGLSQTEQRTHFTMWCMMAAPLMVGNDPRHMSRATADILTAPEVLAVSQDAKGQQARKVWSEGIVEIWHKALADGSSAVMLFNKGAANATDIHIDWARDLPAVAGLWARELPKVVPDCKDSVPECRDWAKNGECESNAGFMLTKCKISCPLGCPPPSGPTGPQATALVRDLWLQEDQGVHTSGYTARLVEPHEGRLLKLTFGERDALIKAANVALGLGSGAAQTGSGVRSRRLGQHNNAVIAAATAGGVVDLLEYKQLKHQVAQLTTDLDRSKREVGELGKLMALSREQTNTAVAKAASLERRAIEAAAASGAAGSGQKLPTATGANLLPAPTELNAALDDEEREEQQELARMAGRNGSGTKRGEEGRASSGGGGSRFLLFFLGILLGGGGAGLASVLVGRAQTARPARGMLTTHAD